MGPAALVLDLDLAPEISALVPVGLAVRSYPNSPFAWPSLRAIASLGKPRARLVAPRDDSSADCRGASSYGGLYVERRRQSGTKRPPLTGGLFESGGISHPP